MTEYSKAQQMFVRWIDWEKTVESVEGLAKDIDARCRVEGYLYTDRKRIVFSDGSKAVYTNHTLKLI